mmetsp:Transcript_67337/g.189754  ORF Transcript_67337/g.189754 Transcript_67337/m.189754 type:complete len:393 (-) Transcript_67337:528-1706(-)
MFVLCTIRATSKTASVWMLLYMLTTDELSTSHWVTELSHEADTIIKRLVLCTSEAHRSSSFSASVQLVLHCHLWLISLSPPPQILKASSQRFWSFLSHRGFSSTKQRILTTPKPCEAWLRTEIWHSDATSQMMIWWSSPADARRRRLLSRLSLLVMRRGRKWTSHTPPFVVCDRCPTRDATAVRPCVGLPTTAYTRTSALPQPTATRTLAWSAQCLIPSDPDDSVLGRDDLRFSSEDLSPASSLWEPLTVRWRARMSDRMLGFSIDAAEMHQQARRSWTPEHHRPNHDEQWRCSVAGFGPLGASSPWPPLLWSPPASSPRLGTSTDTMAPGISFGFVCPWNFRTRDTATKMRREFGSQATWFVHDSCLMASNALKSGSTNLSVRRTRFVLRW